MLSILPECADGRWGPLCESECDCVNGWCDPRDGSCVCYSGWEGAKCQTGSYQVPNKFSKYSLGVCVMET